MMCDLPTFLKSLNLDVKNPDFYREAFMHKTFATEHDIAYDNQRLEFLGDAVVQIIVTEELFHRYPDMKEGAMTKIRSAMVNQEALATIARNLHLGEYLQLGRGEKEAHGDQRDSTLSDLFEAFMGAIFLDSGMDAARDLLVNYIREHIPEPADIVKSENPKGALQEFTQQRHMGVPKYHVASVTGPEHQPLHRVEVTIPGYEPVSGYAFSRKQAESDAARRLLAILTEEAENKEI